MCVDTIYNVYWQSSTVFAGYAELLYCLLQVGPGDVGCKPGGCKSWLVMWDIEGSVVIAIVFWESLNILINLKLSILLDQSCVYAGVERVSLRFEIDLLFLFFEIHAFIRHSIKQNI